MYERADPGCGSSRYQAIHQPRYGSLPGRCPGRPDQHPKTLLENCNEDGTVRSFDDLKAIYEAEGVTDDRKIIRYCRIGERSSLSWFVLEDLLGNSDVLKYDGSWTEWGNLVGAPIEKGA